MMVVEARGHTPPLHPMDMQAGLVCHLQCPGNCTPLYLHFLQAAIGLKFCLPRSCVYMLTATTLQSQQSESNQGSCLFPYGTK